MVLETADATTGMMIDRKHLSEVIAQEEALVLVREAARGREVFLVGGSVRDALLGRPMSDLDLAVDGPVEDLARRLDPDAVLHERFGTAEAEVAGKKVDFARARSERYPSPGALPVVEPAGIEADLARRDFTINALAVSLGHPDGILDPSGGLADLDRRVIRVIHRDSFTDDPTRALRAARYAARLGFDIDHRTAELLPGVDLGAVSTDRLVSECVLIAGEPTALEALRLAAAWGLLRLGDDDLALIARSFELLDTELWAGTCSRADLVLAVTGIGRERVFAVATDYPGSPSLANEAASRLDRVELTLARAAGAEWLDRWMGEWRLVSTEVSGDDLLAAGIPRGAAIGAGLDAALAAALDQGLSGHEAQLAVALAAARSVEAPGAK
jgi:tRNA nucleotidyltransferase (CCA-adding enzyme)